MQKEQLYVIRPFKQWLSRITLVLLLFIISRMLFFAFNYRYFSGFTAGDYLGILFYGIRFDLSAVLMLNGLFVFFGTIPFGFIRKKVFQGVLAILFVIVNSLAMLANLSDIIYFRYTLKRTTGDIFSYLAVDGGNDLVALIPTFIADFWFIALLWICTIWLLAFIVRHTRISFHKTSVPVLHLLSGWLLFILVSFFTVIGIRGGFQLKPVSIINAAQVTRPDAMPLVVNTPFSMIKTIDRKGIPEMRFTIDTTLFSSYYHPGYIPAADTLPSPLPCDQPNIVIILLESFSKEYSGYLNPSINNGNYQGYTPFLDSLMKTGFTWDGYANGKRSIEAIPAILAGIPSLMPADFITSVYAGNRFNSLPEILGEQGYHTSFFHGGKNGTMGFDAFASAAGIKHYYGKDEYPDDGDFDGNWGIYDQKYLPWVANTMGTFKEPFFSMIFTLSSHHPYKLPEGSGDKYPEGSHPIHKMIRYSDDALRMFFKQASTKPWFDNTVFIITADHTAQALFPFYQTPAGTFAVPLVIWSKCIQQGRRIHAPAMHIDVLPTILDITGYHDTVFCFGKSLFRPDPERYAYGYLNENWYLSDSSTILIFDGKKCSGMYDITVDSTLTHDIQYQQEKKRQEMENYIKAVIYEFNTRMAGNTLTAP